MSRVSFPTPEDVEQAFYEAIESGDLERLMTVWSEDDEIVCLHPNGHRLVGHLQIRDSWRTILGSGRRLQVRVARAVRWQGAMLAVHSVIETLQVDDEAGSVPVAATNIYVRGATGWRMLVHHASPLAADPGGEPGEPPEPDADGDLARPKVLH